MKSRDFFSTALEVGPVTMIAGFLATVLGGSKDDPWFLQNPALLIPIGFLVTLIGAVGTARNSK